MGEPNREPEDMNATTLKALYEAQTGRGPAGLVETGSTQCRDVAVVVAEDQEPLARAFGLVGHQAIVPPGIRMGDCRRGR